MKSTKAARNRNAIAAAIWMAISGSSFRQVNTPVFRTMLTTYSAAVAETIPHRELVRRSLDIVHAVVVRRLERQLQSSPSFSITFDGWTARGLFNAYVAVLYSFVDERFLVCLYLGFRSLEIMFCFSRVRFCLTSFRWTTRSTPASPWRSRSLAASTNTRLRLSFSTVQRRTMREVSSVPLVRW